LQYDLISDEQKDYSCVNNAPSYALSVNINVTCNKIREGKQNGAYKLINSCIKKAPSIERAFFDSRNNQADITSSNMCEDALKYFFREKSSIFQDLTSNKLKYLYRKYNEAGYPIDASFFLNAPDLPKEHKPEYNIDDYLTTQEIMQPAAAS
jgi:hypothetical protein